MREKVTANLYDIPKLEFGKRYFIAYGGITYGEEFIFTRKKRIELCNYEEVDGQYKKISSYWVSKRYLKRLLNSKAIHWMGEFDENE